MACFCDFTQSQLFPLETQHSYETASFVTIGLVDTGDFMSIIGQSDDSRRYNTFKNSCYNNSSTFE